jgi:hypothetical protein
MAKSSGSKPAPKQAAMKSIGVKKSNMKKVIDFKGKANSKSTLQKVGKKELAALGSMSLNDKVKSALEAAGEGHEAQAAELLKQSLTKLEHSKVWNQYNNARKNNPEIEDTLAKGKKEKGLQAALWFVKTSATRVMSMQMACTSNDKVTMKEEWQSEKQMRDQFGDEFQSHLNSGRILWRTDPFTRDCYQYRDQGNFCRTREYGRGKNLQLGQEYEADDDMTNSFKAIFDQDLVCTNTAY